MTDDQMERFISAGQDMWLEGYLQAVGMMRSCANDFKDKRARIAIIVCAGMVEAAKPTKGMMNDDYQEKRDD